MRPVKFKQANSSLSRPDDMTKEECILLPTWKGQQVDGRPICVSCWRLTDEDLKRIFETKRIWVGIHGVTHAPYWVDSESPFKE